MPLEGGVWYPDDARADGTANDAARINTAKGKVSSYGKFGIYGSKVYGVSAEIDMNANGLIFEGNHGTLKVLAAHSGDGVITWKAPTGGQPTSRLDMRVNELVIDFNSRPDHPRGISNFAATGGAAPESRIFKGCEIIKVKFRNHNTKGKELIYLRNPENRTDIDGIWADGIVSDATFQTVGILIEDASATAAFPAIHGNIDLRNIYIAPATGASFFTGVKWVSTIDGTVKNPLNRVRARNWHLFNFGSSATDNNTGLHLVAGDGGGPINNRHWSFSQVDLEDFMHGIKMTRTGNSGVWGAAFNDCLIEDKTEDYGDQGIGQANERTLVDIGPGFSCYFGGGTRFMVKTSTDDVCTGINVADSTEEIVFENCWFKDRTAGGTFNIFNGLLGEQKVYIRNCLGYNPVGIIATPWATNANADKGIYNVPASPGQASPFNTTIYTVYQTAKRITITGATTVTINGQSIGQGSGSWVLNPNETIQVAGGTPVSQVYCY